MVAFVSLHSHSTYSFLDGFGHPQDLVKRVKELGQNSIALTDHGSVSGHPMLEKYGVEYGIKPVFGCEFYIVEDIKNNVRQKNHLTVLAKDQDGYGNLLKLVTASYRDGFYYKPSIDEKLLFDNQKGLIILSGCWSSLLQTHLKNDDYKAALDLSSRLGAVFGNRLYLELQHYSVFKDTYQKVFSLSNDTKIPIVVTIDSHYMLPEQGAIRELLWSIRDRRQFNKGGISSDASLMSGEEIIAYLKLIDEDILWEPYLERTCDIAEQCNVTLRKGSLPKYDCPDGKSSYRYLSELCAEGMKMRGIYGIEQYRDRMLHELELIHEKRFEDYFLLVWDVVNWAKSHGVLVGPGRGSSGGVLVSYCLGITEVDPIKYGLLFERFIDPTRLATDLPDIDVDFEDEKRNLVREYIRNKYGDSHVVQLGTFAQFKGKNSLYEVGKAFSIPVSQVEKVKGFLIERSSGDMRSELSVLDTFEISEAAKEVSKEYPDIMYSAKLEGQYRHMSSHAAGVLISSENMDNIVAFYRKSEDGGDPVASIDYDGAKYLDLVKLDLLGLAELTMIREIFEINGLTINDVYKIPLDDQKTLDGFKDVNVLGVFQAEGESTKSVLRQMHTSRFSDIVDAIALSKPGPSHGMAATSYLLRRNGKDAPGFDWHPMLDELTKDTNGQIIYQEQVMKIVRGIGNFGMSESSAIQRAMSKSVGEEFFNSHWPRFLEGAVSNGFSKDTAKKIWDAIKTHGRWSFNLAHSTVYGVVTFWSMYTKVHFPMHFYLLHIKHEKDSRNKRKLMQEAIRFGLNILGPRFGYSNYDWSIDEKGNLRAGLLEIFGIGDKAAREIIKVDNLFDVDSIPEKFSNRVRNLLIKNSKFFSEQDDYFRLSVDPRLYKFHGDKCIDIDWDDKTYPVTMAGSIFEMNYKSYEEELRSRGRDISNIKSPYLDKYVVCMFEDETDTIMLQVNRYNYPRLHDVIWEAYNDKKPILVKGMKTKGWRIVSAKEVELL